MIMNPGVIAFIVIYCVVLFTYFITETSGKMKLRAPNKIVMATMYLVFGIVMICTQLKFGFYSYYAVLIAALILAWLGDVFLLFSFNRGGDFFLAGNICFSVFYIVLLEVNGIHFTTYWWFLIIYVVLNALICFAFFKFPNTFKLGKMKMPMLFYLASITLHGCFGIVAMAYLPNFLLMGLGSFLFMLSDFDITLDRFVFKSKWTLRLNSALYFVGLLLIVLNFAM